MSVLKLRLHDGYMLYIPESILEFQAVKSSGPGGQHVNKTSSAVILQLNTQYLHWPEKYQQRLLKYADRRISNLGVITIKSQSQRSQFLNKEHCVQKLCELLQQACYQAKFRKPTKPSRAAKQRRLTHKKQQSEKKGRRKKLDL